MQSPMIAAMSLRCVAISLEVSIVGLIAIQWTMDFAIGANWLMRNSFVEYVKGVMGDCFVADERHRATNLMDVTWW